MKQVFSLIANDVCDGDRCIGIYTTFDKCYQMLKEDIEDKWFPYYDKQEVKNWYSIYEISLDDEISECGDFTTGGKEIEIGWEKLFKEIEDKQTLENIETRALAIELNKRLSKLKHDENQTESNREKFSRISNLLLSAISILK